MVGGTFVSVGEEAIDIQDITVTGDPDDEGAWIKWWDPKNRTYSAKALYVSELYSGGEPIVPTRAGWGDADWEVVTKTFAPGEGFWWGAVNDGLGLTLAGEVVVQPATEYIGRTIETAGQQQMIINAFPTALNIQDITVKGDPDDEGAWIKWWDAETRTYSAKALYVSELYSGGDPISPTRAGWGDADWEILDKTFNVGDGFWWGVNKNNCTLCIPNPFYNGDK